MKKGILISLLAITMAFTSSLYAFQYTKGSAFVFADVLEWQVREGSADMVGEQISPVGTANPSVKLLDAPFNWNTGFRIGVGYKNLNQSDSVVYYTGYHTQATNQISAPGQVYSPYLGNFFQNNTNGKDNGPFYDAASVRWKINYNTLDFELGRTFKIDNILTLRPFLGLKGAIINQNIYTNWQGPNTLSSKVPVPITTFTSATENLSNYFSGIGPAFGLNTTWPVHQFTQGSVNLIGDFSAALLWGLWRYKDIYQTDGSSSVNVTGNTVNGAAPMTKAFVGLEWMGSFSKADVNVRLGYEGQVWFDQLQFNTLSSGRLNDLMSLQGAVLDFRVNF
ncbi:MAG: Lpg1974 family pore-forming outer membrane protein [Gammaproteobacteria bacterium]|nr:Lpg1974 family pore-forming outer membrane protein [Gammaproteobacteria bacterium]